MQRIYRGPLCFEEGYKPGYNSVRYYINGFYDVAEMKQAKAYGLAEEKQTILNVGIQSSAWRGGGP